MSRFALPDLGEGLQDAEIVAWHVVPGDHVVADQPLVSVETEKAVVEIPAPHPGRVARLLAAKGERVKVGAPLIEFDEAAHADAGAVVGELGSAPTIVAAPAIRKLARARDIDLALVKGSGPGGSVTEADVMRAAAPAEQAPRGEKLGGIRRRMAENMARAHAEVVPATITEFDNVEAWWSSDADVTLRLVRAMAAACGEMPALNARYDGRSMMRELLQQIDLGIAMDTEQGLVVPVLRDIAGQAAAGLRQELDRLKQAARARSLAPADLRDPTITLSNFGMLAGRHATLVVLPPQVAIVGAGRVTPQAVPRQRGVGFAPFLPLSLTFDHRVVTGGEAARFLGSMLGDLERAS